MNTAERPHEPAETWPGALVWLVAAALVAVGLVLHATLPRYELRPVGVNGDSVVVFDRWTGQFQRVDYLPGGEPRATSVVDPF
jgi:hypothetical protein